MEETELALATKEIQGSLVAVVQLALLVLQEPMARQVLQVLKFQVSG
jgi:hypothetical protein